MENMCKLTHTSFHALQEKMEKVLDLIKNDLDMALASGQHDEHDIENRDRQEEDRLRKELADKVKVLKRRHEVLLSSNVSEQLPAELSVPSHAAECVLKLVQVDILDG